MNNNFNIEGYLVQRDTKISEVIKMLQEKPIKMIVVVSDKNILLGSITDGDIRRGLLNGFNLEDKCYSIMNDSPSYALEDEKIKIDSIISEKQVTPIIVDANRKVISLYHNQIIKTKIIKPNNVVIMAGGKGERLMPLTENTPKPLLTINEKPIIQYIIEAFIKNGFENITLSVGYRSEKLIDYFNNHKTLSKYISYISEKRPLDTAGALSLMPREDLNDPVIVKNGDIITNVNYDELLKFHNLHDKPVTICASEYKVSIPFGSITTRDGVISKIIEKPTIKHHINAGIYVINPDVIKNMKKNVPISMIELLDKHVSRGNVIAYPLYESWIDIGSPEDFKKAQLDNK